MKTLELQQWTKKGQDLLKKAEKVLRDAPFNKIRDFASRIPSKIASDGKALQVVFAGQYSAGKSSIIKVMTGREDIEIGSPPTTEEAQQFDWNGIKIVDTPGIHTELRPDHDEITYEAISKADLLVFVITNELFDSHIAKHFRKLAIEREKAHEMLLVVNKMQRSDSGNTPSVQDVIREDIRKVLAPYTPEELRISFVDAEAALEAKALAEQDEERSGILQRKSGFDTFYDNFNAFVREKELAGRYTTSLYTLEQVLALAAESSDDSDSKALEEVLLQKRSTLVKGKADVSQAVESKVLSTTTKIQDEGRQAADLLHIGSDFEDADEKLKAAQDRIQEYTDELSQLLPEEVGKHIKSLAEKVDQIAESELVKTLIPKLEVKIQDIDVDPQTLATVKGYSEDAHKLGRFLVEQSFNPQHATSWFKFRQYSGTPTHDTVKSIGHFFGKSFKPWEAVKWTRRIANAGRGLAVVGIFVSVAAQIKEEADAAKQEQELREGRAAIRAGFDDAAREVELHFDEATNTYVDEIIGQELAKVDAQLKELRDMQQSRSNLFQNLNSLLEDTRELISEMHSS